MLNRIGSPQSSTYRYPAMCCRCGSPEPTTTGLVMKSMHNRIIRFSWEKVETFTLTVPACTACKMFLDTHTYRAGLASIGGYMLGASVALFLAYPWLEWFFLIIAAWWGGALTSRLLTSLYRWLFYHPQGTTWPELCTYDDNMLTFKQSTFQREFIRLNAK